MPYEQRISKTDLARSTHRVIRDAQRGYIVLVENHGQPEVAIVDIVDFQLQRAAIHYFSSTKEYEDDLEISESMLEGPADDQQGFNLVIGHYLAEHQGIGHSAELLGMSTPEFMIRLGQAGLPLRVGPTSLEELKSDIETIKATE